MKLASLRHPTKRDGELLIVSRDLKWALRADSVAPNLREAVENWSTARPKLEKLALELEKGAAPHKFPLDPSKLHSPFPRTFQWADGSAFLQHVKLVRKARNAPIPDTLEKVPLMYQGGSDSFLTPTEDIPLIDENFGVDFEGEVAVVTDDVPMGVSPQQALEHIVLIVLVNDVTLRGLIPDELAQGFGFFQSKPSSAFSPCALTPDELGPAWKEGRVHLPLLVDYNGKFFGNPDAGAMHFHFGDLIAHAARTRSLAAGTVIGSGTVSNEDLARGSSCIVEKRMLEKINEGEMHTPFMKAGDTIRIRMLSEKGENLFGDIDQRVVPYAK